MTKEELGGRSYHLHKIIEGARARLNWNSLNFSRLEIFSLILYNLISKITYKILRGYILSLQGSEPLLERERSMNCNQCGACCIAPSISTLIPETGKNKPAGTRCVHLSQEMKCLIYDKRPAVCCNFTPTEALCGKNFSEAYANLEKLEILTSN